MPGPGDEVLYSRARLPRCIPSARMAVGATPVAAPETDLTFDVDAMLARVTPRTRLVFLANPNNPTGTYHPARRDARGSMPGLPPSVLLVIDAAYAEFVQRNDYEPGIELVDAAEQRRDDAHLLEDLRARRHAARLGLWQRRRRRRAEPRARPVQCQLAGAGGRHRGARRRRRGRSRARRTTTSGGPGSSAS